LPGSEVFFVGVGASDVEVELVGVDFGEEIAAASEVFEIEERVFSRRWTVSTSLW
jgi:hypothetical protein